MICFISVSLYYKQKLSSVIKFVGILELNIVNHLFRRKREENKKHIEQSVKERQKVWEAV